MDDLLRNIRLNVIVARVKPYKTVSLDFLCKELTLPKEDICGLLSELILEEKIKGEIDQLNGFLEMSQSGQGTINRHGEIRKWAGSLTSVHG